MTTHRAMAVLPNDPNGNLLLACLSDDERERLSACLDLVSLPLGELLQESGVPIRHAFFPVSSVVSLHHVMESGATAEFAGVGNEGLVGIARCMGGDIATHSAIVQSSGLAWRARSDGLHEEFARGGLLHALVLRYAKARSTQVSVGSMCHRFHTIEQQLCRWLLLTLDRLSSSELVITQEFVASLLGVRRVSITETAGRLQDAGCITSRRGHISVLDRASLEARTCECYGLIRNEFDLLRRDARHLRVHG